MNALSGVLPAVPNILVQPYPCGGVVGGGHFKAVVTPEGTLQSFYLGNKQQMKTFYFILFYYLKAA